MKTELDDPLWLGVVHILRNQLRGRGFSNDYATVIWTLCPCVNVITEGGGSRIGQKLIT